MLLLNAKLLDLSKAPRGRGREHRSGDLPPTLDDGDGHTSLLKHHLHCRKGADSAGRAEDTVQG